MPVVGQSIPHDSARGHVTGEAPYIDDLSTMAGELFVSFVGSPCAAGVIESVDTGPAVKLPGVVGVFTHRDVLGHNLFGPVIRDEPFLAEDRVLYVGQPVVVVAAASRKALAQARRAVKITVKSEPAVLSIDEAIRRGQFIAVPRRIERGDFDAAWARGPLRLEGVYHSKGQEQFYLESQAAIAYPGEDGQLVVHSSTQNPTEIQAVVAEVLGLHMHQVVCVCKRMGGGFGGKETQAAIPALMAALVAQKTGRPARVVYSKDDDMKVTGKRHPYQTRYRVAFDPDGRVHGAAFEFYSDGGCSADLSTSVLERTMLHADNAYFLPHVRIDGRICRTNYPSNTAFRGFGGPQGVAVIENIMQEIALATGRDALDVRRINCYGHEPRNVTPYGQVVRDNTLPEIFDTLERTSDYRARRERVARFNAASRTHLRGLALTAVKFGISFTTRFLNQGNALVNVYTDGTVQVSTGATEMGQGVNTKIRQLVADEFGIGYEHVLLMPTSTEKNNNTSPTAASAGTDLNGTAAVFACREIRARLADFAARRFACPQRGITGSPAHVRFENGQVFDERTPENRLPFGELANQARRERIDLGARGFYATPGIDFNRDTGQGNPFYYFTTGAAVAEVLIDRFTGDLTVPRVDLLMDIGRQINPGVDGGQVVGGFIQGMGWVTAEDLRYDEKGNLLSYSPTTYKIPNVTDVPADFRVAYLDRPNPRNIGSSKAVGEPPLLLGISVWAAVKDALAHVNSGAIPDLRLPATNEEILLCLTRAQTWTRPATSSTTPGSATPAARS